VNAFNDYFINVVDTLITSKFNIYLSAHLLQNSFPQGFLEIVNISITETIIVCIINSMKNKESSGYDKILNRIL
jgi:hypothetical protein